MLDIHHLDDHVARKLLTRSDQGHLSLYNYTDQTTFSAAWDEITLAARGLVIDRRTGEVVARPFDKFFNLGERGVDVHIPSGQPDAVTVKHDGSLGILYREEGQLRWTTRGRFGSPQGRIAEQLWARQPRPRPPEEWTILAEIIHPDTLVIVRYDFEALILLGARDRHSGAEIDRPTLAAWAAEAGLPMVEEVEPDFPALVERARCMDASEEGFVARWGSHRVKVKSHAYIAVARVLTGLSDRGVADLWVAGRALPPVIPEEVRDSVAEAHEALDREAAILEAEVGALVLSHRPLPRPEFVRAVGTEHPLFGLAMMVYTGKPIDWKVQVYQRRFRNAPRPVGK